MYRGDLFSAPASENVIPADQKELFRSALAAQQNGEREDTAAVLRMLTLAFEESVGREKALMARVNHLEAEVAHSNAAAEAHKRTMDELVGVAQKAAAMAESRAAAAERRTAERERAIEEEAATALGAPPAPHPHVAVRRPQPHRSSCAPLQGCLTCSNPWRRRSSWRRPGPTWLCRRRGSLGGRQMDQLPLLTRGMPLAAGNRLAGRSGARV